MYNIHEINHNEFKMLLRITQKFLCKNKAKTCYKVSFLIMSGNFKV